MAAPISQRFPGPKTAEISIGPVEAEYSPQGSRRSGRRRGQSLLVLIRQDRKANPSAHQIRGQSVQRQPIPSSHADAIADYSSASAADVSRAIDAALAAKKAWENLPFVDRAAIFLKAADLVAGKYRYQILAQTMLGQGKNAWQAEIDAAAELCDFLR